MNYEFDELLEAKLDAIIDIRAQIASKQLAINSFFSKHIHQVKTNMSDEEVLIYEELIKESKKDMTKMQSELIKLAKTEERMLLECRQLKNIYREGI